MRRTIVLVVVGWTYAVSAIASADPFPFATASDTCGNQGTQTFTQAATDNKTHAAVAVRLTSSAGGGVVVPASAGGGEAQLRVDCPHRSRAG